MDDITNHVDGVFRCRIVASFNRICSKYTNSISCNEFNVKQNSDKKHYKV